MPGSSIPICDFGGMGLIMSLVHTLLFLLRKNALENDMQKIERCLKSLEKSTGTKVVVFNQGMWGNEQLEDYLRTFRLDCDVIGEGVNTGTVVGRQRCFEHIWEKYPDTAFISELHPDMVFTAHWEDALVEYLKAHDEPLVGCGVVEKTGNMPFLDVSVPPPPAAPEAMEDYLESLKRDEVVCGFTNPCIHKSEVLREVGGYDAHFLKGMHAFEDDSMLLGYYYYYGTRASWRPKVNYRSVVYHETAGQRFALDGGVDPGVMVNYSGLVRQYGAMGIGSLARLHKGEWQIEFFNRQFRELCGER